MTAQPARSLRYRSLLAVVAVLVAMLPPGVAGAGGSPQITVMTRNLYLGTSLNNIIGVSSLTDLVAAMSRDWANVLANDFPTRAGALATRSHESVRTSSACRRSRFGVTRRPATCSRTPGRTRPT
jgi:hypothetical protein